MKKSGKKNKSSFKELWSQYVTPKTNEEILKRLKKIETGLELEHLEKPQAEITRTQSEAFANLINSIKDVDNAVIQCGPLLILKRNGNLISLTLTQKQLMYIDENPNIIIDTEAIFNIFFKSKKIPPKEKS